MTETEQKLIGIILATEGDESEALVVGVEPHTPRVEPDSFNHSTDAGLGLAYNRFEGMSETEIARSIGNLILEG